MISPEESKELFQFFASNFHQDFSIEFKDDEGVIANYIANEKMELRLHLAKTILRYAASFNNESDLISDLFDNKGCGFDPRYKGISVSKWLYRIATKLNPDALYDEKSC